VIAPAKTGKESNNNHAVIKTLQTNKLILWKRHPGCLILIIVVMKLIAPIIELAPAICKLKIAKSTEGPE